MITLDNAKKKECMSIPAPPPPPPHTYTHVTHICTSQAPENCGKNQQDSAYALVRAKPLLARNVIRACPQLRK